MKTHFRCFWFMRNELSWQYDNFIQLIGPTALSSHVMPACTNGSLSLSLFSFPFLVFFLSILLSRSLHSSFFFLLHGASTTPQIASHRYRKPPLNHSNLKPEPKSQRWRRTNSDSNDSNDLNLDHSLQRTTVTLASSASNSPGEGSDFS